MIRFALDTNSISYALRGEGGLRGRLSSLAPTDVGLPSICVYEIWRGARMRALGAARMNAIERVVSAYRVLPFDAAAAQHAAEIAATLAAAGTPIGPLDVLIAGVARAHGATLVTHNVAEFARVPGLRCEDWY